MVLLSCFLSDNIKSHPANRDIKWHWNSAQTGENQDISAQESICKPEDVLRTQNLWRTITEQREWRQLPYCVQLNLSLEDQYGCWISTSTSIFSIFHYDTYLISSILVWVIKTIKNYRSIYSRIGIMSAKVVCGSSVHFNPLWLFIHGRDETLTISQDFWKNCGPFSNWKIFIEVKRILPIYMWIAFNLKIVQNLYLNVTLELAVIFKTSYRIINH